MILFYGISQTKSFGNLEVNYSYNFYWYFLLLHYQQVQYNAVIRYTTTNGEATYVDTDDITTTSNSYMFTLLNPSTDYTFTVTSYTEDGESSSTTLSQTTMDGRKGNISMDDVSYFNYLKLQKTHHSWNFTSLTNKIAPNGER